MLQQTFKSSSKNLLAIQLSIIEGLKYVLQP